MFRNRLIRLGIAVGIAGLISSQLPLSNGTAMADDDYNLGGGNGMRKIIEVATVALAGYGIISTFTTNSSGSAGGASVGGAGGVGGSSVGGSGGGAVGGAANSGPLAAIADGPAPIFDVTRQDADLSTYGQYEEDLESDSQNLGSRSAKQVLSDSDGKKNQQKYTVFPPINSAFQSLSPDSALGRLAADNPKPPQKDVLLLMKKSLVAYHAVAGTYTISDLKQLPNVTSDAGAKLTSLAGTPIYFHLLPAATTTDQSVLQISNAPFNTSPDAAVKSIVAIVRQTDTPARNGLIHPIDHVLVPPSTLTAL